MNKSGNESSEQQKIQKISGRRSVPRRSDIDFQRFGFTEYAVAIGGFDLKGIIAGREIGKVDVILFRRLTPIVVQPEHAPRVTHLFRVAVQYARKLYRQRIFAIGQFDFVRGFYVKIPYQSIVFSRQQPKVFQNHLRYFPLHFYLFRVKNRHALRAAESQSAVAQAHITTVIKLRTTHPVALVIDPDARLAFRKNNLRQTARRTHPQIFFGIEKQTLHHIRRQTVTDVYFLNLLIARIVNHQTAAVSRHRNIAVFLLRDARYRDVGQTVVTRFQSFIIFDIFADDALHAVFSAD